MQASMQCTCLFWVVAQVHMVIALQVAAHPAVAHALKVRKALVFARYTTFFQLYAAAPNLGRALMDTCFSKVRFAALETIVDGCKASKVKMLQLASMLGFLVEPSKLAQLETAAHQQSTEVELDGSDSMVLPGCRQTSYSGKYPAEVNSPGPFAARHRDCQTPCCSRIVWSTTLISVAHGFADVIVLLCCNLVHFK